MKSRKILCNRCVLNGSCGKSLFISKIAVFFMTMLLLNWNPRLTFNDMRKKIWIRGVDYEIAVAITNPLKTITGPLKKIKMLKIDLKKVPSQNFFFARLCRYVQWPNFLRKKKSHFTIPLTSTKRSFINIFSHDRKSLKSKICYKY